MVKAFIAISFILLYSFSNTELSELGRLPMLVHHYMEHKAAEKDLSFFSFLKEHYGALHKTTNGHHKQDHQQLPFKVHDHNLSGNTSIAPLACISIQPSGYDEPQRIFVATEKSFFSHFLADIWQPPKA